MEIIAARSLERPRGQPFETYYGQYTIRSWERKDREKAAEVVSVALAEHGLNWDGDGADKDVVDVEGCYWKRGGEFWVIEGRSGHDEEKRIIGTGAFYPVSHRGRSVVEIRKMYLAKEHRSKGIGRFLLNALESRIEQLGFRTVVVETASVLKRACRMYKNFGYKPAKGLGTARCDKVLSKPISDSSAFPSRNVCEILDTRGYLFCTYPRDQMTLHKLLHRQFAALVLVNGKVLLSFVRNEDLSSAASQNRAMLFQGITEVGKQSKQSILEKVNMLFETPPETLAVEHVLTLDQNLSVNRSIVDIFVIRCTYEKRGTAHVLNSEAEETFLDRHQFECIVSNNFVTWNAAEKILWKRLSGREESRLFNTLFWMGQRNSNIHC